jgi:sialate O-acetylesterase
MNSVFKVVLLEILLCVLWKFSARPADKEKIELATIFGDNMVVQRGHSISIWGKGTPQDRILIRLGTRRTVAIVGDNGCWTAVIPPLKAGGPYELTVGNDYPITLHNVFVGDVWLCAGQSNMLMPLSVSDPAEYRFARIDAQKNARKIRFFIIRTNSLLTETLAVTGPWLSVNRETIPGFSAVAYHFARQLEAVSNIPIGIIQCPAINSSNKWWINFQTLGRALQHQRSCPTSSPYNDMIVPICDFAIKGVVWYQGESDIFRTAGYAEQLTTMIHDWRVIWKHELPFLIVQLPSFSHSDLIPRESSWANLREAQFQVSKTVPNTYLIVSMDTSGINPTLHPLYKQEIGERLANTALSAIYGRHLPFQSPFYDSMRIQDNKILISFSPTSAKLMYFPELQGFAIAGRDKKFYWADATIQNAKTILVSSPEVSNPVAVRYAWADNPNGDLYSSEWLPIAPFRTDSWRSRRHHFYDSFVQIYGKCQSQLAMFKDRLLH